MDLGVAAEPVKLEALLLIRMEEMVGMGLRLLFLGRL